MIKDFKNLFINGEDSDVMIKVKSSEFKVHKCILRDRSPVFYSIFNHDMMEKNSNSVDINDWDPETIKIFLLYFYNGCVEDLSINTVIDLYKVADKYDTKELRFICTEFMQRNLSTDTVCDAVELALLYNEKNLLEIATEYFIKITSKLLLRLNGNASCNEYCCRK